MTPPEVRLWARLKRLRAEGVHFRRQAQFRSYYLDFVCYAHRLIIEVDGGHHTDAMQAEHDGVRDAILTRQGFTVQRYSGGEVMRNADAVMEGIMALLANLPRIRESKRRLAGDDRGMGWAPPP